MNYEFIYNQLISKAKNRHKPMDCLLEKHHIIPKSIGGSNLKDNIVYLTTREHFVAHLLLVKINKNNPTNLKKMTYALWWMSKTRNGLNGHRVNSWAYEYARKKYIELNPNKDEERKRKFKENHQAGLYKYDYKKVSDTLKNTLKQMNKEELSIRMKKSTGSCDQIKRGNAIKKGKSSTLELEKVDGSKIIFSTYDDIVTLTGYNMQKLIYHIKRDNGLLPNGSIVRYIIRYTGNDSRIGKKKSSVK